MLSSQPAAASQEPKTIYVDDVHSQQETLSRTLGVEAVLADVMHVMRRYVDTLTSHHPARGGSRASIINIMIFVPGLPHKNSYLLQCDAN